MLWQEALTDVRELLQDEREVLRWQDDDIRRAFNAGLRLAYQHRPDLFLDGSVPSLSKSNIQGDDPDAPTLQLPLIESYCSSLCEFAASWCFARDDEYTADGRVAALRASFMMALIGTRASAA